MISVCLHRGHKTGKKVEPLTEDQRLLADENINLARWMIREYPIKNMEKDEMLAEALLVVCRVAKGFNPEIARFSTMCLKAWFNYRGYVRNVYNAKRNGYFCQMELSNISIREDGSMLPLHDPAPSTEAKVDSREEVANMLHMINNLAPRERQVVLDRLAGDNNADIARRLNISRERVRQIYDVASRKLRRRWKVAFCE